MVLPAAGRASITSKYQMKAQHSDNTKNQTHRHTHTRIPSGFPIGCFLLPTVRPVRTPRLHWPPLPAPSARALAAPEQASQPKRPGRCALSSSAARSKREPCRVRLGARLRGLNSPPDGGREKKGARDKGPVMHETMGLRALWFKNDRKSSCTNSCDTCTYGQRKELV